MILTSLNSTNEIRYQKGWRSKFIIRSEVSRSYGVGLPLLPEHRVQMEVRIYIPIEGVQALWNWVVVKSDSGERLI